MSNDKIRQRVQNIYAAFVTDVDPYRLSDYLKQEGIISIEQWQEMCGKYTTTRHRCRALLDFLLTGNNPRSFLIVRNVLENENHHLLGEIDDDRSSLTEDKKTIERLQLQLQSQVDSTQVLEMRLQEVESERDKLHKKLAELEKERDRYNLKKERQSNKTHLNELSKTTEATDEVKGSETVSDEIRYTSDPVLVQTIGTNSAVEKEIFGLTILDKELFVVRDESSEVEVYDSLRFSFSRRWKLTELNDPWDIGSCNRNRCLYIFEYKGHDKLNEILRVDSNGKLIRNWSVGDNYGRLSVTDESNVILTVYYKNKLNEYSPDGQLIRKINLSSDAGIQYPWHAIKLANGHFLVSHGFHADDLHKVCLVDAGGKLKKSFGGKRGSTMGQINKPVYLCVDGNGFVMVVDRRNSRVLLLDSDLQFKREILSKEKHGLRDPGRIVLDETNGQLFVADNNSNIGRVFIFDFK